MQREYERFNAHQEHGRQAFAEQIAKQAPKTRQPPLQALGRQPLTMPGRGVSAHLRLLHAEHSPDGGTDLIGLANRVAGYWRVPTLLWLGDGDAALKGICVAGVALAAALLLGIWPAPLIEVMDVSVANLVEHISQQKY